jgi:hypothetical protein
MSTTEEISDIELDPTTHPTYSREYILEST